MAFKPGNRVGTSDVAIPENLRGILRQTDLNDSNDKADVALFDFLDLQLDLLDRINKTLKDNGLTIDKISNVTVASPPETYVPTLTDTTNITASTPFITAYKRSGNIVNVFGKVEVQTTGAGDTELEISLPILSYFLNDFECSGVAACPTVAGEVGAVIANTTNFTAMLKWQTAAGATFDMFFNFSYRLIAKS